MYTSNENKNNFGMKVNRFISEVNNVEYEGLLKYFGLLGFGECVVAW